MDILKLCKILQNLKKLPDFTAKIFKTNFVSEFKSSNQSARLENLCWPIMIVKLRNGPNLIKNFENNRKF